MSKHTPGPWWTTDHGIRDVGGYIAHTNSVQRYEGQDERYAFEVAQRDADKRLIASAPELLEAAIKALGALNALHIQCDVACVVEPEGEIYLRPVIHDLRQVIAKATGEQA